MTSLRVLLCRLQSLFGWQRRERALQDEIQFHFDMQIEENVKGGMGRREAEYAARRSLGGVAQMQEVYRDYGRLRILENVWRDLRFAGRMIGKTPGIALTAILTIALGIGINASVFTLLDGVAMRPLALPDSGRLVDVYQTLKGKFRRSVYGNGSLFSLAEYLQYRERNQVFSGLAAYSNVLKVSLAGSRETLEGDLTTCNYFEVLQSAPVLGRGFLPGECAAAGAGQVVVLSDDTWQTQFGGDMGIVGKIIRLDRQPMTVVGVAGPGFRGTELAAPAFWTPLVNAHMAIGLGEPDPRFLTNDDLSWLAMIGRLRPGASLAQARADLRVIAAQIDEGHPGRTTSLTVDRATLTGVPEERTNALALGAVALCAVGLVLLIGCANLINLMLARAAGRRREIAVRLAIGAGRWQLICQLLIESLLLSLIGGTLGTLVAVFSASTLLTTLIAHLPPDTPKLALTLAPDVRVFAYCLALMVATGLLFGLVPALQATRPDLTNALKQEEGWETRRGTRSKLRGTLIGVQVAVCALLLLSAGLLLHGLYRGERLNPGFDSNNIVALHLDLGSEGYGANGAANFQIALTERLRNSGNLTGVTAAMNTPFAGRHELNNFALQNENNMREMETNRVLPNYFSVLGIPLVTGRTFTEAEANSGASVGVITQATARRLWPGEVAIGKRVHNANQQIEVIGITADTRSANLSGLDDPYIYLPLSPRQPQDVLVRFPGNYSATVETLRAAVRELDPNVTARVSRINDNLVTWIAPARVSVVLVSVLGVLALLLASIGIYGTAAYSVSRRIREISIRMMLGARSSDVLRLVMRQAMRPVLIGAAIGAGLSIAAAKLLSALLFGVSAFDVVSLGPAILFLILSALLATYLPARRALRADPMQGLRQD